MRRFHLIRVLPLGFDFEAPAADLEKVVAEGVMFADGTVVVHWVGEHPSTVFWPTYEDFEAVSVTNHPGQGHIEWIDD